MSLVCLRDGQGVPRSLSKSRQKGINRETADVKAPTGGESRYTCGKRPCSWEQGQQRAWEDGVGCGMTAHGVGRAGPEGGFAVLTPSLSLVL